MMTQDTTLTLTSCKYSDLAKHSKVINVDELDYFLWIYLNPEYVRDSYFVCGSEMSNNPRITFHDTFTRPSTSWIRVKTSDLNKEIGLHTYKFLFADRITSDTFSLYANYIIQSDNQEKPYIYMKRDSNASSDNPVCINPVPTTFTEYNS